MQQTGLPLDLDMFMFQGRGLSPFASMFLHTLGGSDRFTMPAPGLAHP
jgi:hypothetical protein